MDQRAHLAAIALPKDTPPGEAVVARNAIDRTFTTGYRWTVSLSALLALIGAITAAVLIPIGFGVQARSRASDDGRLQPICRARKFSQFFDAD